MSLADLSDSSFSKLTNQPESSLFDVKEKSQFGLSNSEYPEAKIESIFDPKLFLTDVKSLDFSSKTHLARAVEAEIKETENIFKNEEKNGYDAEQTRRPVDAKRLQLDVIFEEKSREREREDEADAKGECDNPIVLDDGRDDGDNDGCDNFERECYEVEDGDDDGCVEVDPCPWFRPEELDQLFDEGSKNDEDVRELWHCDGFFCPEVKVVTTAATEIVIEGEIFIDGPDEEEAPAASPSIAAKPKPKPPRPPPTPEMLEMANKLYFNKIGSFESYFEERKKYIENGVLKDQSNQALLFLHREKMLRTERMLRVRRRSGHPDAKNSVLCRICQKPLKRRAFAHLFEHGPQYTEACPACPAKGLNESELIAHFRSVHFGDEELKCDTCGVSFYSPKDLQRHRVCHSSTVTFNCPICFFRFLSNEEVEEHVKSDHPKVKQQPKKRCLDYLTTDCEICGATLQAKNKTQLKNNHDQHVSKHSVNRQWLTCDLCGKSVSNLRSLRTHYIRRHTPKDVRPFACPFEGCNKSFKLAENLSQHRLYHAPPRFQCDKCGKKYYWSKYLEAHKLSKRNDCY